MPEHGGDAKAKEFIAKLYANVPILDTGAHGTTITRGQGGQRGQFARINLFTIDQTLGGWCKADREHFFDGGSFDQIYVKKSGFGVKIG
jgi:sulfate transport system substrate-binding protein